MRTRLAHLAEVLRSGFLFIPGLFLLAGLALAFGLTALDRTLDVGEVRWQHPDTADAARLVLSTIAGSIITTAGIVFSITIAALTQASSQFGPRLLRAFVRDRGKQIVLGTFVATFVYCLLVLRSVEAEPPSGGGAGFIPHISIAVAIGLAVVSIGVLVYFIHNVAVSLQAPSIVAAVAQELDASIDRIYPEPLGDDAPISHADAPAIPAEACPIRATRSGYVQAVDAAALFELAERKDVVVSLRTSPGRFLTEGQVVALVWPAPADAEAFEGEVAGVLLVGAHRTPEQDVSFALHQLVEVAVRALSTGVNDPFTALQCVDWLGHALARMAGRQFPSPLRRGRDGRLRVIAPRPSWDELVDAAFDQIRLYGRTSLVVTVRLLDVIATIAEGVAHPERRSALRRHAEMIVSQGRSAFHEPHDVRVLEESYEAVLRALDARAGETGEREAPPESGRGSRAVRLRRSAENA